MPYVIAFVASYLLGSIPMSYLTLRVAKGKDLRREGSGNVGAFNVHFVTGSKFLSITAGVLDGLKGLVAVLVAGWLTGGAFWMQGAAFAGVLIGHNYPVWLGFHGGRGLATAVGGFLVVGSAVTVVWGIIWIAAYKITKDILYGNLVAILVAPIVIAAIPVQWPSPLIVAHCNHAEYSSLCIVVSLIHFARHQDVVKEILLKIFKGKKGGEDEARSGE